MSGRIAYLQYTNPAGYPPLEHSSRILADAGWKVTFLGAAVGGVDGLVFPPHPGIEVRQLGSRPVGWRQKVHYLKFCARSALWALRSKPQWVYVSDMLACPPAWLMSRLSGARLVYHEHDSPGSEGGAFTRFCRSARRRVARRAALCVLPNEMRARRFAEENACTNVAVVWNCPSLAEAQVARRASESGGFRLYYHGNISPRLLPEAIVHALARLPEDVELEFVGYETAGHRGYGSRLERVAATLGLGRRVRFRQAVPRHCLLPLCRAADAGLALVCPDPGDINLRGLTGASNKVFDYLACGLAVLVPDEPGWRAMFVAPGLGLACDPTSPDSIASALHNFYTHPTETRTMGERGRQRILERWNYEAQFEPVRRAIQQ